MAVLGVLFGVVLSIGALLLPFLAYVAAGGARTRAREVAELARARGGRADGLANRTRLLRAAVRKLQGAQEVQ